MPLEVRHIAVRLRVGDPAPPPAAAAPPRLTAEERAALVRDCTRAVLAALGRRAER